MFFDLILQKSFAFFVSCSVLYHACTSDPFFNATCKEKTPIEAVADTLLIPYQYALTGRVAQFREDGSWYFEPRFNYATSYFWLKTIPAWIAAPFSFIAGGSLKMGAYVLSPEMQERYKKLKTAQPLHSCNDTYQQQGLYFENPITNELFQSQNLLRGPNEAFRVETEALHELGQALNQANILWWVDCGTCLGAYRYGGAIPWDFDIDIAILEPDFQNAYSVLSHLNPDKYLVFDLSGRDSPMSLLKIYLRSNVQKSIDIYCFRIHPQERTLSFILSLENNIFLPRSWKTRERPFKAPVKFDDVFPLKRATFDGVSIFVPNKTETYLKRIYGENLAPAKVYNPETALYEKDLTHPYWDRPYAH